MLIYSLAFGLLAWGLGLIAVCVRRKPGGSVLSFGSFLCAAVSATVEFFDIQRRAYAGDFAGIEDTIRAVIIGVTVMFAVTFVLNFFAMCLNRKG